MGYAFTQSGLGKVRYFPHQGFSQYSTMPIPLTEKIIMKNILTQASLVKHVLH